MTFNDVVEVLKQLSTDEKNVKTDPSSRSD